MYEEALEDANKSIEIKPDWGKSYFRKGMVLAARGNISTYYIRTYL